MPSERLTPELRAKAERLMAQMPPEVLTVERILFRSVAEKLLTGSVRLTPEEKEQLSLATPILREFYAQQTEEERKRRELLLPLVFAEEQEARRQEGLAGWSVLFELLRRERGEQERGQAGAIVEELRRERRAERLKKREEKLPVLIDMRRLRELVSVIADNVVEIEQRIDALKGDLKRQMAELDEDIYWCRWDAERLCRWLQIVARRSKPEE